MLTDRDGVFADEIEARDVPVQIDAYAGPIQARRHLFDMRGLARAMEALHEHPAVVCEARQDGERGVGIETIAGVGVGNVLGTRSEGWRTQIAVDAEHLADRDGGVWHREQV